MSDNRDLIVIVGAGIIGLNVASVLAERGLGRCITVVAEHLPGDGSINYTSPWAGANFSAISGSDSNALRWDRAGYQYLMNMAKRVGKACFIQPATSTEYWDEEISHEKIQSLSEYLEDFRAIPAGDLPDGVSSGVSYTTVTINTPKHLEWFYHHLKDVHDIRFTRRKIANINDAYLSTRTRVVFNCTGNGAKSLKGVEDANCYPTRGQIVLAKAPDVRLNMVRHGRDHVTYIIPRPFSGGNVILGGYMQKGVSTGDTFSHETDSIMERTRALSSEVEKANPEILAVLAGLRPSRDGGARVEATTTLIGKEERLLIHNYGAGGTGFQAGRGMALDAVASAESIFQSISEMATQAKL
ncbi:putative D-amino acid oxidase [Seiridium cardinale]|uniref:D-amino acid oxidase n=1 Tax=Seiridium cardinale TaxID=138064 RepID=A0ABR2Y591_9PEZI